MTNSDLIRKFYALPRNSAAERADLLNMLADDIEYVGIGKESARGREAVERLFRKYEGSGQTDITFEFRHIAENGEAVLADMVFTFTIQGRSLALPYSLVFRVRDGKINFWQEHYDIGKFEAAFGKRIPVTEKAV